ncbi:hypothetical protein SGPA1_20953 [Streptomyces misionensis JCM 4497]
MGHPAHRLRRRGRSGQPGRHRLLPGQGVLPAAQPARRGAAAAGRRRLRARARRPAQRLLVPDLPDDHRRRQVGRAGRLQDLPRGGPPAVHRAERQRLRLQGHRPQAGHHRRLARHLHLTRLPGLRHARLHQRPRLPGLRTAGHLLGRLRRSTGGGERLDPGDVARLLRLYARGGPGPPGAPPHPEPRHPVLTRAPALPATARPHARRAADPRSGPATQVRAQEG